MKDEFKEKIISEFVGLKSKVYSLIIINNEKTKKARGVNKNVVKTIRHTKYIDVLFNKTLVRHKMEMNQSKFYRIGTYDVCRISVFCFDNKRHILDDGISSLAYFHKDVKR